MNQDGFKREEAMEQIKYSNVIVRIPRLTKKDIDLWSKRDSKIVLRPPSKQCNRFSKTRRNVKRLYSNLSFDDEQFFEKTRIDEEKLFYDFPKKRRRKITENETKTKKNTNESLQISLVKCNCAENKLKNDFNDNKSQNNINDNCTEAKSKNSSNNKIQNFVNTNYIENQSENTSNDNKSKNSLNIKCIENKLKNDFCHSESKTYLHFKKLKCDSKFSNLEKCDSKFPNLEKCDNEFSNSETTDINSSKCITDMNSSKCTTDMNSSKCTTDMNSSKCMTDMNSSKCTSDSINIIPEIKPLEKKHTEVLEIMNSSSNIDNKTSIKEILKNNNDSFFTKIINNCLNEKYEDFTQPVSISNITSSYQQKPIQKIRVRTALELGSTVSFIEYLPLTISDINIINKQKTVVNKVSESVPVTTSCSISSKITSNIESSNDNMDIQFVSELYKKFFTEKNQIEIKNVAALLQNISANIKWRNDRIVEINNSKAEDFVKLRYRNICNKQYEKNEKEYKNKLREKFEDVTTKFEDKNFETLFQLFFLGILKVCIVGAYSYKKNTLFKKLVVQIYDTLKNAGCKDKRIFNTLKACDFRLKCIKLVKFIERYSRTEFFEMLFLTDIEKQKLLESKELTLDEGTNFVTDFNSNNNFINKSPLNCSSPDQSTQINNSIVLESIKPIYSNANNAIKNIAPVIVNTYTTVNSNCLNTVVNIQEESNNVIRTNLNVILGNATNDCTNTSLINNKPTVIKRIHQNNDSIHSNIKITNNTCNSSNNKVVTILKTNRSRKTIAENKNANIPNLLNSNKNNSLLASSNSTANETIMKNSNIENNNCTSISTSHIEFPPNINSVPINDNINHFKISNVDYFPDVITNEINIENKNLSYPACASVEIGDKIQKNLNNHLVAVNPNILPNNISSSTIFTSDDNIISLNNNVSTSNCTHNINSNFQCQYEKLNNNENLNPEFSTESNSLLKNKIKVRSPKEINNCNNDNIPNDSVSSFILSDSSLSTNITKTNNLYSCKIPNNTNLSTYGSDEMLPNIFPQNISLPNNISLNQESMIRCANKNCIKEAEVLCGGCKCTYYCGNYCQN